MSSVKLTEVRLSDYEGPFFPDGIDELHWAVYGPEGRNFKIATANSLGREIQGFVGTDLYPRTNNKKEWFFLMKIRVGPFWKKRKIAILFPWGMDDAQHDGTSSDQHMAVYLECAADIERARWIVKEILSIMRERERWQARWLVVAKALKFVS